MIAQPDFTSRLRAELVAAADRQALAVAVAPRSRPRPHGVRAQRWTSRTSLALGAAAALVAGVIAVSTFRETPADAGVSVDVGADLVVITLTNHESRPELIERELRDAGLDVDVTAAAVGPSLVGQFVGTSDTDGDPRDDVQLLDPKSGASARVSFPRTLTGHVDLTVGRAAGDGEQYERFSDAYAEGEPLACSGIYGLSVLTALDRIEDEHLSIGFTAYVDGPRPDTITEAEVAAAPYRDLKVTDAIATSATSVNITLTADGVSPNDPPLSPDRGACPR